MKLKWIGMKRTYDKHSCGRRKLSTFIVALTIFMASFTILFVIVLPHRVEAAEEWIEIDSTNLYDSCGGTNLAEALDGSGTWVHEAVESHWFILDLRETYTITSVHGRSLSKFDPIQVNIYVSDDTGDWGAAVANDISTWQDTDIWQEVDTTDKDGRYIKVVVARMEDSSAIHWGGEDVPFTIFDAYGQPAAAGNTVDLLPNAEGSDQQWNAYPPGLYERYNLGDDAVTGFYGVSWVAQTFTIGNTGTNVNHQITSVKLLLYRYGTVGTISVLISPTDEFGVPLSMTITGGSTDGSTLTTDTAGEWREITLTPCTLFASTKYAIVCCHSGGDIKNHPMWRRDSTSPSYTGGSFFSSANSGDTWTANTGYDFLFEEYEAPTHWTRVDDPVGNPDEDGTYVWTEAIDKYEEFNHETSDSLKGADISNVRVNARLKNDWEGQAVNIGVKVGGARYAGATDTVMTSSYANYHQDWAYNPNAPLPFTPWEKSDIDSLQSSLESLAVVGSTTRCTQIYITVTYTSNSAPLVIVNWPEVSMKSGTTYDIRADSSYDPDGEITNYRWNLGNGTIISGLQYSKMSVNYRLFGKYTVNLTVTDDDEAVTYAEQELTIYHYISVVKNSMNNGINYITWGANNIIKASTFAESLGLDPGDKISKFDPTLNEGWSSYIYTVGGGDDFNIERWDHIQIQVEASHSHYFTPDTSVDTVQERNLEFTPTNKGYNYITWSNSFPITPEDFFVNLDKGNLIGKNVEINVYDPSTNTWKNYNEMYPAFATLTIINPYDVICFRAPEWVINYNTSSWI